VASANGVRDEVDGAAGSVDGDGASERDAIQTAVPSTAAVATRIAPINGAFGFRLVAAGDGAIVSIGALPDPGDRCVAPEPGAAA